MDYEVSEGKELVIPGSPDIEYNYVWIPVFNVLTPSKIDPAVLARVEFRKYRKLEDDSIEEAPLSEPPVFMDVTLSDVLGSIEGGTDLYEAVKAALINLGKAQGLI